MCTESEKEEKEVYDENHVLSVTTGVRVKIKNSYVMNVDFLNSQTSYEF